MKEGTYTVVVTRNDIDNGIKRQASCCPIALAVCRTLKIASEEQLVEVDYSISITGFEVRTLDHGQIDKFVKAFDKEELVLPFMFVMRVWMSEPEWD